MTPPKLLLVEWLDHCSRDGWNSLEEAGGMTPVTIITVGWVVKETETFLTLAGTADYSNDDDVHFNSLFLIVKSCITSRKEIDDRGQFVLL